MRRTAAGTLLHAALRYAEAGWAVFPGHGINSGRCSCEAANCSNPGKHPRIKAWQKEATTDEATIRDWWSRWPTANVCIATGAISGLVVLDSDPRHGGTESLARLEQEHGLFPPTPTVVTGSGGLHFYFAHPGVRVPNKTGVLPGLDIRGDGGFVVAPPSRHLSGEGYAWK